MPTGRSLGLAIPASTSMPSSAAIPHRRFWRGAGTGPQRVPRGVRWQRPQGPCPDDRPGWWPCRE